MIELEVIDINADIKLESDAVVSGGTDDYEKLKNKPKLNGVEMIGNVQETDPTVPAWAKEANKPTYTPEEIKAVSEDSVITIEELQKMFE